MKKVPARVRKIENEKLYRIKWIRAETKRFPLVSEKLRMKSYTELKTNIICIDPTIIITVVRIIKFIPCNTH